MKTPKQLADEKAMEIAPLIDICKCDKCKADKDSYLNTLSTHLEPLYECVEALEHIENFTAHAIEPNNRDVFKIHESAKTALAKLNKTQGG